VVLGTVGITGTLGLQYVAFATAPLLAANAVAYAWPLIVAAWTARSPGARRAPVTLALALLGFAGVVLIFAQRGDDGAGSAPLLGCVAALGSALAMAWYTLAAGRVPGATSDLLLIGTGVGAAVAVPIAVWHGAPWSPAWAVALAAFVGVGPVCTGYALWMRAMADPSAPRLAPLAYGTPLLSTLLLVIAGDRLPPAGMAGCALIVACALGVVADLRHPSPRVPEPRSRGIASAPHPRAGSSAVRAADS
jgi:drug/metabolite transporter (DMT)-like permease